MAMGRRGIDDGPQDIGNVSSHPGFIDGYFSVLKSPIYWPSSRNDEHAKSGLTKHFGIKGGDNHDLFLLTSTMMLHTLLLDPLAFQIFLRKLFNQLDQTRVLDDSPASELLSERVPDNDSLRLHGGYLNPKDMIWKECQISKCEQERPVALVRPTKLWWSISGGR
jgi:hypothetical protein